MLQGILDTQSDYVPEKQDFYKDDKNEGPQDIPNDATAFSTSYIP
jgi:hypothetical protein